MLLQNLMHGYPTQPWQEKVFKNFVWVQVRFIHINCCGAFKLVPRNKNKKTHLLDYVNQGKQINCNLGNKILTAQLSTYITCVWYTTGCLLSTCPCTYFSGYFP